jgi:hypothetical protein
VLIREATVRMSESEMPTGERVALTRVS